MLRVSNLTPKDIHNEALLQCHNFSISVALVIPYSRKYWRALNLAVEPKIAIERILADLNLAVRYGIAIRIYASRKFWRTSGSGLAVVIIDRQTAKFNSPPNFPAIRYYTTKNTCSPYPNLEGIKDMLC